MKFSILVPVYNTEKYIEECIDSVLRQTYQNFEIVLINDGSTDKSGEICNLYAAQDPQRIIAVHTENQGPLPARVRGIKESHGDVLVFLDSDDCLREDALQKLAECFCKHSCDMVLYNASECVAFSSRSVRHSLQDGYVFAGNSKKEAYRLLIDSQIPNSVCLKAVRKYCAEVPECFCGYQVKHGEDLLLSAHFMTTCKKIVYIDEGLYHYRNRPASAVHSYNSQRRESIKVVHTAVERYSNEWGLPELRAIHNARKVRGWIYDLILLIKHKKAMEKAAFKQQVKKMAEDPYFRSAYIAMDKSRLTYKYRCVSFFLYHCDCLLALI